MKNRSIRLLICFSASVSVFEYTDKPSQSLPLLTSGIKVDRSTQPCEREVALKDLQPDVQPRGFHRGVRRRNLLFKELPATG